MNCIAAVAAVVLAAAPASRRDRRHAPARARPVAARHRPMGLAVPARPRRPPRLQDRVVVLHRQSARRGRPPLRLPAHLLPPGHPVHARADDEPVGRARLLLRPLRHQRHRRRPVSRRGESQPRRARRSARRHRPHGRRHRAVDPAPGRRRGDAARRARRRHGPRAQRASAQAARPRGRRRPEPKGRRRRPGLLLLFLPAARDHRHAHRRRPHLRRRRPELVRPRIQHQLPRAQPGRVGLVLPAARHPRGDHALRHARHLRRHRSPFRRHVGARRRHRRAASTRLLHHRQARYLAQPAQRRPLPPPAGTSSCPGTTPTSPSRPPLADQELHLTKMGALDYWEGACTAAGHLGAAAVQGAGYTELTGYAGNLQTQFQ